MPGTTIQRLLLKKPSCGLHNVRLYSLNPLPGAGGMLVLQISNVRAARELLQQDAIRYGAEDSLIVDATRRIYADTAPTAAALFALDAWFEDDQRNFQFWTRIFQRLMN
ncbi:hypothetical protein ACRRRS_20255 [Brucella anthropi]|nr:hypothetical protein [Brucella anthropi]